MCFAQWMVNQQNDGYYSSFFLCHNDLCNPSMRVSAEEGWYGWRYDGADSYGDYGEYWYSSFNNRRNWWSGNR